jgi:hypothetical protein
MLCSVFAAGGRLLLMICTVFRAKDAAKFPLTAVDFGNN